MHTQRSLHLSDAQFSLIESVLTHTGPETPDDVVVEALVKEGIRRYPAEKMVEQRARFHCEHNVQAMNAAHPHYQTFIQHFGVAEQQAA